MCCENKDLYFCYDLRELRPIFLLCFVRIKTYISIMFCENKDLYFYYVL